MIKPFLSANWKMNKTISETENFLKELLPLVKEISDRNIIIAPPFTSLYKASEILKDTNIMLAAQDVFYEDKGAYTGEISPSMLIDVNCKYVIIGHSERRKYFHEDDEIINKKIRASQKAGLGVIFCIGETLDEREKNMTFDILNRQIERGLVNVEPNNLIIAYEPVWAIGTGKTATINQILEAHKYIRNKLEILFGNNFEDSCIIYGGSVTPENIDSLMACEEINGVLVGGASLKVESFFRIINFRKV
jgi:triosephosphate isomerase